MTVAFHSATNKFAPRLGSQYLAHERLEGTLPISAVDTITLAFRHTKRQLIEPFRFWQWTRLAIVGLLAGEMGSGGGFNVPSGFHIPQQGGGSSRHLMAQGLPHLDPAALAALIAVAVIIGFVFMIIMLYVSSVMRFVLFDSVLAKECKIRKSWIARQGPGWKFFLWHIGFLLVMIAASVILLGIPAALAFGMGWFNQPRQHLAPLIILGLLTFAVFFLFVIATALVQVLTKDFVVPQMALEGISAIEGWRRLWAMMQAEKSGYAVYIGMKIVLAIGAGIVIGIATILLGLLIAVPAIVVAIVTVMTGKSAGLEWNVFTITAAVVAGCVLFAIFFYVVALISVPAIVFFPAYSIYFFAPRYRPLSLVLYPPPAASPLLTSNTWPPPEPPEIPPTPQPA